MQEQHSSATWRWVCLALLWLSTGLSAAPLQQNPGADGLVVVEAEDFDLNTPTVDNTWEEVFSPPGYSGTSAYQVPNGTPAITENYATDSPRLDYQVDFTYAGTHTVWILGRGDFSNSNSVHVGLDGIELPDPDQALYFDPPGVGWEWSTQHQTSAQVTVEVPDAGVHTVNVWMRESGTYVDKLLLTVNPAYVPDGTEPESPRGTGSGGNLFEDNFDDGDALGWNVVNNCVKGAPDWQWFSNTFMQIGDCRGFSFPQGVSIGTYALSSGTSLPANVDIQLRLRAQDPAADGPTGNDTSIWKYGGIGLLFGYQNADNYYRVELDGIEGHRKLRRKQGGTFTELNTSPQSLVPGQWHDLRVVHQNDVILVFVDGQQVMASADSAFSTGQLGLFCARNASCSFDDILVTAAADTPMVGLSLPDGGVSTHASGEYYVTTSTGLDVAALTSVTTGVDGVEFLLDEGPGETSLVDDTPPYSAQFAAPGAGEHSVTAWLLDSGQARMAAPEARVMFPQVGVEGIHLYAMGDSITAGIFDSISADDDSADGRNTGGGYEPVLNDHLSAANGVPVTVLNDGNSGEESSEGAARIASTLAASPQAQAYLVFYGANDSGGTPTPHGLGLTCTDILNFTGCDPGYEGSFKHNLQQIINAVTGAGKQIFLARAPPNLNSSQRNMRLIEYNMVVDELVAEGGGGYVPPDLHAWFTANQGEFDSDGVHPNGTGYISIARLWCEALNTQMGLWCLDADRDGLVDSVETGQGTNPSLVDSDGDGLADGNDGLVPLAALPGGVDSDGDGFVDGEAPLGTDPLLPDSDGDRLDDGVEVANGADPLDPGDWPALADGDMAPLDAPDGDVNAADLLLGVRMALGLLTPTALELAHGDLYPPGSPDGVFNLQDLILLQGMMQ